MPLSAETIHTLLTKQEHRVCALVAIGRGNKQIAEETGLSFQAVKRTLTPAMEKLGAVNRAQLSSRYTEEFRLCRCCRSTSHLAQAEPKSV